MYAPRTDTITFLNGSGTPVEHPRLDSAKTICHVRHVTQSKGSITASLVIDDTDDFNKGSDTTSVNNGTLGTCDGQTVKSGTITNVTRVFSNGFWQFPSAGSIAIDMPRYTFTINFIGNDQATVTIDNLITNKTRVVTLTVDNRYNALDFCLIV